MSRATGCTCHLLPNPPLIYSEGPRYCPRCTYALSRAVKPPTKAPPAPVVPAAPPQRPSAPTRQARDLVPAGGGVLGVGEEVPTDRYRSQTERRYAAYLTTLVGSGACRAWWYEPMKGLYLAPETTYTPDFLLWLRTGVLEVHEVKGAFIREKDWIKAKLAAAQYPCFAFVLAQWKDGAWHWKRIPAL